MENPLFFYIIFIIFFSSIFMYYSVLWYKNNPLISEYKSKYLCMLKKIFEQLEFGAHEQYKKAFFSLSEDTQNEFLLHPDVSSLLYEMAYTGKDDWKDTLLWELKKCNTGDKEGSTLYSWECIPRTKIYLTDMDNNPHNTLVDHPDQEEGENGMMWWWEKTPQQWKEVFSQAFEVLAKTNEDFFHELNSMIQKIVPMKTAEDVHNSASYKGCIGTLYLWYTTKSLYPEIDILEALIHESSHNKLNLIMQSEKLLFNDTTLKYYSPYRPDARHVLGVFLWVHAIIPTVYVMLEAVEKGYITHEQYIEKVVLYHIKNKLWYRVLQKHAQFSNSWKKVFDELGKVLLICDKKIRENTVIQKCNLQVIQYRAKEHFLNVKENYPYVQY